MYNKEEDFYKAFFNVFLPKIEKETELNEDDINKLYMIEDKKKMKISIICALRII